MSRFRGEKHRCKWDKMEDISPPRIRRLLDQLCEARWDMGPLKVTTPTDLPTHDDQRFAVKTPVTGRGMGEFGIYMLSVNWIKKEIKRKRAEDRKYQREQTERHIGAFI